MGRNKSIRMCEMGIVKSRMVDGARGGEKITRMLRKAGKGNFITGYDKKLNYKKPGAC